MMSVASLGEEREGRGTGSDPLPGQYTGRRSLVTAAAVMAGFVLLTLAWTWPLPAHLGTHLRDLGDPLLNSWILDWNVRVWQSGSLRGLFDAPIFYPHTRTLAYSEHLFPQGVLALALRLVSDNPVLAHNLLQLLGIWAAGCGAFWLAFELSGSWRGGAVAGALYAFSAFPLIQLSHLQSQWSAGLPLTLVFLHRFLRRERRRDLAFATLAFVVGGLANNHFLVFTALFAALLVAWWWLRGGRLRRQSWAWVAVALLLAAVAIAPFAWQYLALRHELGFSRAITYWARPASFLTTPPGNLVWGNLLSEGLRSSEEALYPGIVPVLLAGGALTVAWHRRRPLEAADGLPTLAGTVGLYAIALGFFVACTFGPYGPFGLLHRHVPGLDGIRVASRFVWPAWLALGVLAAIGMRHFERGGRRRASTVATLAVVLTLLEQGHRPLDLAAAPWGEVVPKVYRWLAQQPSDVVIAELPFSTEGHEAMECRRVFFNVVHEKRSVNGYSGYMSPTYAELARGRPLAPQALLQRLFREGVRYVLVHRGQLGPQARQSLDRELRRQRRIGRMVARFGRSWVIDLRQRPVRPRREAGARSSQPPAAPREAPRSRPPQQTPGPR